MIELKAVHKVFNQDQPNETWAVKGVDLIIPDRRMTVLKGPSGSGKTTLLTLIGCLARPSSGRVRIGDKDVSSFPERFLADVRRRTFGFVFQNFNLLRGISVLENVMVPAYPLGTPRKALSDTAYGLLERLGIADKAHVRAELLSGGEAQRAAIARAMINSPSVLIADEPTANLDTALSADVLGIFADLKAEGTTLVMSSHDPLVWQSDAADHVVSMRDGMVSETD